MSGKAKMVAGSGKLRSLEETAPNSESTGLERRKLSHANLVTRRFPNSTVPKGLTPEAGPLGRGPNTV